MYITLLCVMFDIKDYEMDYNQQLKTFVVKLGLHKTIYYIIIPLCALGLGCFIGYAIFNHFHPVKILLNMLPFLLVIMVAYRMNYRRSIFYYLVVIDGLMLVKALCGSIGMLFF
jgi:4-hydroxybenzoate polyprenyltransferase